MNNASEQRKRLILRFPSPVEANEFVEEVSKMPRDARLVLLEALRDDAVPASNRWWEHPDESKVGEDQQDVSIIREDLSSADEIRMIVKRIGRCGEDVQDLSKLLAERVGKHLNG